MHDEVRIPLLALGIGPVVVNPVRVEGRGRVAEQVDHVRRPDLVPGARRRVCRDHGGDRLTQAAIDDRLPLGQGDHAALPDHPVQFDKHQFAASPGPVPNIGDRLGQLSRLARDKRGRESQIRGREHPPRQSDRGDHPAATPGVPVRSDPFRADRVDETGPVAQGRKALSDIEIRPHRGRVPPQPLDFEHLPPDFAAPDGAAPVLDLLCGDGVGHVLRRVAVPTGVEPVSPD